MKLVYVYFVLYLTKINCELSNGKLEFMSLAKYNGTKPRKYWNLKVDFNFTKTLPPLLKRKSGADIKLKCEAIMNFTQVEKLTKHNERIETSVEEFPLEYKLNLMKVDWLKGDEVLTDGNIFKISSKVAPDNGTIVSVLKIKNIQMGHSGNYTCAVRGHGRQTTRIVVEDDSLPDEIPTYGSLYPDSLYTGPFKLSSTISSNELTSLAISNPTVAPQKLQPICQEYVGKVCSKQLQGRFVYIPYNTTQELLEEKLLKATYVIKQSKDISPQCNNYERPSLCYSTFPICRDPIGTNINFFKTVKEIFSHTGTKSSEEDAPKIVFENLPQSGLPEHLKPNQPSNELLQSLDFRYNSTVVIRVCKHDCEILETELCQKEYAIAKRHPHIGKQLNLEECQNLPEDDPDCLKIGVGPVMVSNEECYWENGRSYLGRINVANNGLPCIEWSKQMKVKPSDYPELAGRHSYCRNPGGLESQPWCFVDKEGKTEQYCDIPKCAHEIWKYIVIVFFLLTLIIIGFIICICCKNKLKKNATTLMDMNLPNADKNIYGNSRLNSPIEMNDLMNQNSNNPMNPTRNVRGNGILRVPQYTLSQIRFLEELGEGAFGKVYKGALNKGGETQFIAVKALKENASAKTQQDFRREIDLISELRHDNIVCIVGVALREEPLCMLFEFMARGDLHEFLMGRAPPSGKGLPAMRLLNIAQNIASGMQYLASHHYVHRDLAARNCLVSDDFVVKISDFGLSRDIYSSDYYRVQSKSLLPVRWMPPESILYGKFTTESDIWSYGVVLWEIYSYGLQPYYGYSNQEVISMVRGGELLACPTACPAVMYALMQDTWKHMPQRRPLFDDIVVRLQTWIDNGGCPETGTSDSSSVCSHRQASSSSRELQERMPLLAPHSSTGSLKMIPPPSDSCSMCSETPVTRHKKGSCGSLIDSERSAKDTVIRIPNARFGNEI